MMDKKMPNSLEAEQYILANILISPKEVAAILSSVEPDDFYYDNHKKIMTAIKYLYDNKQDVNYTNIIEELKRKKEFDAVGGQEYILELVDILPQVVEWENYASVIKQKSVSRELYNTLGDLSKAVLDNDLTFEDILVKTEDDIKRILNKRRTAQFSKIDSITDNVIDVIEKNSKKESELIGIDTGFKELNSKTFGFKNGELIIIAARPGIGKSALALNITSTACEEKKAVAFISLEMGTTQLVMRLLSSNSGIGLSKIISGKLNESDITALYLTRLKIDNYDLYLDDSTVTDISEIMAQCRELKRNKKLDMVVVDYLQLIGKRTANKNANRAELVGSISRSLKILAMELDIPVIALSQLNRESIKRDVPNLADLRESGSIEQDADIVLFLHKSSKDSDSLETRARSHRVELIIAKNRQGEVGNLSLTFQEPIVKFIETTKKYN
ncbi:MAG: replicative DNA helicase [Bacilli bacterium]|jgi:replicative DNA helicase|nr:replicative DNA helicase [Bacilli bacterium]MDD2681385.1 replicative DNA helicase [Bacilli bacterium]MDD3120894.1 replicative DNA helicase [Bacilli bacterium]MDD4063089.1 replicative DNA helicase [Bacilli bacterium]MDD4481631.1 replicative DNA helicase [Bacilli bacterium]